MLVKSPSFAVPDVIAKELTRFLEDQIIFGNLLPGERLVEEEIVRRHDVSRSPVRESFRMLEQDGLVVRESRKGVWVSPIDLRDLDEVYVCRLTLESLAAEVAATSRTNEQIERMRAIIANLRVAHDSTDLPRYFRENVLLTDEISGACGNATLRRLLKTISKQALRYRWLAYSRAPDMLSLSLEANQEIVDAIARGRGKHARMLTEDILQQSWNRIRGFFPAPPKELVREELEDLPRIPQQKQKR
jgi:DNA-binding GntR family transcriptional regulator